MAVSQQIEAQPGIKEGRNDCRVGLKMDPLKGNEYRLVHRVQRCRNDSQHDDGHTRSELGGEAQPRQHEKEYSRSRDAHDNGYDTQLDNVFIGDYPIPCYLTHEKTS